MTAPRGEVMGTRDRVTGSMITLLPGRIYSRELMVHFSMSHFRADFEKLELKDGAKTGLLHSAQSSQWESLELSRSQGRIGGEGFRRS